METDTITLMKTVKYISNSEEETEKLAGEIALGLNRPANVTLTGELGAGKTVFSRGFARALGVTGPISSPTFTIVQEYEISDGLLYHMDLYRIADDEDAVSFGIEDYLNDPQSVCLIEWPQRLSWLLPETLIKIEIKHVSESQREISYPESALC
jgi:tRNA threonylcarbamoyladenosine biosynthesis protein TsaE